MTPRVLWHDAEARGFRDGVSWSGYDCRAAQGGLIVGNMSERLRNDTRRPSLCSGISSSKTPSRSSRADAPGKGACARPDPCAGRRPAAPFSRCRSFSIAAVQSPACIAVVCGRESAFISNSDLGQESSRVQPGQDRGADLVCFDPGTAYNSNWTVRAQAKPSSQR